MPLTTEILQQSEGLKDLTPEQLNAIVNLSTSNEKANIGKVLTNIDDAILGLTGNSKPHGMFTSDFVKTELNALKKAGNTTEIQAQLDKLKQEKTALETQIANGSQDSALKGRVSELEQQLTDKQTSIEQLQTNLNNEKERYQKDLYDLEWKAQFNAATSGLKYKSEDIISEGLRRSHLSNINQALRSELKIDYTKEGDQKRTIYRDKDGILLTSPKDASKPATLKEILTPRISDLIEKGHTATGAGTRPAAGATGANGSIIVSGAKTKVEATSMIEKQLATQGVARNSPEFQEKLKLAYSENNVSDLPLM